MFLRGIVIIIAALLVSDLMPNAFLANAVGWGILILGALYLITRGSSIKAGIADRKSERAAARAAEDPFARMARLDAAQRRIERNRKMGL